MSLARENRVKMTDVERELLPLNVLLHCRTVVEGKNFVTTGVMTHVEGELFEVELNEFDKFELGEPVKMTIYSPAGIQSMPSIVFAKYEGAIALLQPPDIQRRFVERRDHPRVEVDGNAQIVQVLSESGEELAVDDHAKELKLIDISLSGLSFSSLDGPYFAARSRLKVKVEIGFGFNCELEIVRRERQEDYMHCGAKMQVLEPEMLRPLRALILRRQVENNAKSRQEIVRKRPFSG